MLLGASRTALLAGWSGVPGQARSTMTLTADVVPAAPNFVVTPRYYLDYTTGGSMAGTGWYSPSNAAVDQTGAGTTARKSAWCTMFRVGNNWGTGAPNSTPMWGYYTLFNNNGTDVFLQQQVTATSTGYQFSFNNSAALAVSTALMATLRNRWLALISATSDTTADFANWTGTGSNPYGWCVRNYLVDVQANTVIATQDSYATFNPGIDSIDLSQTWTVGYLSSAYYVNEFVYFENAATTYSRNDIQFAQNWMTIGNTWDPAQDWPNAATPSPSPTIGGVRAWFMNLQFNSTPAIQTVGSLGARQPSDYSIIAIDGVSYQSF
jgi:hypothetical protein